MAQAVSMLQMEAQEIPNHSLSFVVRRLSVRTAKQGFTPLEKAIDFREPLSSLTGFTLLEVLIATVILTVGIIAIMWAFNSGMYASTDIENVDLALNIGQAKMEEIKNSSFASLTDSGPTPDPNFSRFSVTVNVSEGQNPMQVDVTVSWPVKAGEANIGLITLVADYST